MSPARVAAIARSFPGRRHRDERSRGKLSACSALNHQFHLEERGFQPVGQKVAIVRPAQSSKEFMTEIVTSEARSAIMRRVRRENTGPEMAVRRTLHRMGYRFRLHAKELPGSPDVVFRPRKAVVFVHGCFWHGHECRWGRPVKSNAAYWAAKIARNQQRDAASLETLRMAGWLALVVWECELKAPDALEAELRAFLGPPGKAAR